MIPNPGRSWRHFDGWLMGAVAALVAIGVIAISSASHHDAMRQMTQNLPPALIALAIFIFYGYNWLERGPAWVFYGICLVLLIAVEVIGHSALGAQRWIALGPIKVQPSEYAKLALIIILAKTLSQKNVHSPEGFLSALGVVAVPALLIFKQPDLGTSLVFAAITFGMLFWAGLPVSTLFKMISPVVSLVLCLPRVLFDEGPVPYFSLLLWLAYMLGMAAWLFFSRNQNIVLRASIWIANLGAGLAVPIAWNVLKEYQKNRIRTFISPEADPLGTGYHVIQSKIAIGSGGVVGKGLYEGTQTQLHFIPEQHTDFVFSVVGEELGFIGGLVVLSLFCLLFVRALFIAERAKDKFGSLLAVGILSMLLFHTAVNLGMCMGLMPVVGIPLPLISYGGTALMTNMAAIGLLQAISMRRKKLLF